MNPDPQVSDQGDLVQPMADLQMSSKSQDAATVADNMVTSNELAEAGATEPNPAKLPSAADEESSEDDSKLPTSTDRSLESSQSTLESDEGRLRSHAQRAVEPLPSPLKGEEGQVTGTCKLAYPQNGTKISGSATETVNEPQRSHAAVRTKTCLGMRDVKQAPAPLPTYFRASTTQQESADAEQHAQQSQDAAEGQASASAIPSQITVGLSTRSFSNEFIYIGKSKIPGAGFGIFAVKDITSGEHILLEYPLIRTTVMDLFRDYDELDPRRKAVFDSLSGFHLRADADHVERIFQANSFQTDHRLDGVFPIASNFNHACLPKRNVGYIWDGKRNLLVLTAIKDVKAHDELLISYGYYAPALKERFGFTCTCGGCFYSTPCSMDDYLRDFDPNSNY